MYHKVVSRNANAHKTEFLHMVSHINKLGKSKQAALIERLPQEAVKAIIRWFNSQTE